MRIWMHFLALTGVSLNVLASCSTDVFSRFWNGFPLPVNANDNKIIRIMKHFENESCAIDGITWKMFLVNFLICHEHGHCQGIDGSRDLIYLIVLIYEISVSYGREKMINPTTTYCQHNIIFLFNFGFKFVIIFNIINLSRITNHN